MSRVTIKGLDKVLTLMDSELQEIVLHGVKTGFKTIGLAVRSLSIKMAPISPDMEQYRSTLKTEKGRQNTTFKATPGTLRKSITVLRSNEREVEVGVPSNSPAGDYANRMHNKKYNLGVGSRAAQRLGGEDVGPKFLDRAVDKLDGKGHFR